MTQGTQTCFVMTKRGGVGREMGEGFKRRGTIVNMFIGKL